jgi:hypothetical protein
MQKVSFANALSASFLTLSKVVGVSKTVQIEDSWTLSELENLAASSNLDLDKVLSTAALHIAKVRLDLPARTKRDALTFLTSDLRPAAELTYTKKSEAAWLLTPETVKASVLAANLTIEVVHDLAKANSVPIFEILGLRNLSSFVGEIFARELQVLNADRLVSNPNQDGYPDLCALTHEGKKYMDLRHKRGEMTDKGFWSPFPYGGIEVKGTCGNTPGAKKIPKPKIGESRYPILCSAEWKAHHRQTNNLAGIYWDFIDGLPTVLAVFFRNDLVVGDWGKIIQPKEGGGKTTSVSIMTRPGVEKMAQGWIVLPDDEEILARLTQSRVFPMTQQDKSMNSSVFKKKLSLKK